MVPRIIRICRIQKCCSLFLFSSGNVFGDKFGPKSQNCQFKVKLGTYNLGHNILKFYNVSVPIRLTTSKGNVISSIRNLVYELPHELPNNLRLKDLSKEGNIRKISNLGGAQSPPQKLNLGNSRQNTRKSRYQTFLALSSFTGFLYFVPNILSRIVH